MGIHWTRSISATLYFPVLDCVLELSTCECRHRLDIITVAEHYITFASPKSLRFLSLILLSVRRHGHTYYSRGGRINKALRYKILLYLSALLTETWSYIMFGGVASPRSWSNICGINFGASTSNCQSAKLKCFIRYSCDPPLFIKIFPSSI